MQKTGAYKNCNIDARAHERKDGAGWMAEVYISQDQGRDTLVTQFILKETFPTAEAALDAAVFVGRQKIDVGFEPKSVGNK